MRIALVDRFPPVSLTLGCRSGSGTLSRLEAGLHAAINRWFDDARAAVVQAE